MLLAAGVAAVLGLYTGWIAHTRETDRIVTIFGLISAATVLWVGGSALKLLHTDRDRWLRPKAIVVLFAIPLAIIVPVVF